MIPRSGVEADLVAIWSSILESDEFDLDDDFFDLGGTSVKAMQLQRAIRDKFGYDLPIGIIFENATIARLGLLLRGPAMRDNYSAVVPINPGGSGVPVFCFHPIGGGVARYAALGRALGEEVPLFGLQAIGLNPERAPHDRVEDMAAHYVQEIRQIGSREPCVLIGYSFGGLVAFEVACRMIEQGNDVAFVALVDVQADLGASAAAEDVEEFTYKALVEWALNLPYRHGSFRGMARNVALKTIVEQAVDANLLSEESGLELVTAIMSVISANYEAFMHYQPRRLPCPVLVFNAEPNAADDRRGWQSYAKDVSTFPVPGNHVSMMDEPAVAAIADVLRELITHPRVTEDPEE
jgi:thioesterase domain-containing protein/aryl carrier-like protein